jgi:hypothetical protein
LTLFINLHPEFKDDAKAGAWFFSSYFSAPAVFAALVAVLARNMTPYNPGLAAWLVSPPAFVIVGFLMVRWMAQFMIVGR